MQGEVDLDNLLCPSSIFHCSLEITCVDNEASQVYLPLMLVLVLSKTQRNNSTQMCLRAGVGTRAASQAADSVDSVKPEKSFSLADPRPFNCGKLSTEQKKGETLRSLFDHKALIQNMASGYYIRAGVSINKTFDHAL